MKRLLIICLVFFTTLVTQAQNTTPFSIGETVSFYSETLQEERTLNVYIPKSYAQDSLKTYPVIYLLDGSADEDFIHISGLVQFLSFSWMKKMPEAIVVGIANVDRKRDFTYPTNHPQDKVDFPTSGHSEAFIKFIETELQPYASKHYRISENNTILGQSLGGLLATEILFKKPQLFSNYIIVSPSFWWDDQSLLKLKPKSLSAETKVYIAVGKEGQIMETDAKALHKKLKALNSKNLHLNFKFLKNQDHGDALHLAVYSGLEWLFGK